jgi:hypothetical protein
VLKNSGFGWGSTFSATVNALELVRALAAEVTGIEFFDSHFARRPVPFKL